MKLAYEVAKAVGKFLAVRRQSTECSSFTSDAVSLEGGGEWSRRRSATLHLERHVVGEHVFDPPGTRVYCLVAARDFCRISMHRNTPRVVFVVVLNPWLECGSSST